MSLPSTYSRRKRSQTGASPDVYHYDDFSDKLRRQIVMIISDAVGDYGHVAPYGYSSSSLYDDVVKFLRREQGVYSLINKVCRNSSEEFFAWLEGEDDIDDLLDGLEVTFYMIDDYVREHYESARHFLRTTPDQAIAEFNARMAEEGVGYSYENGIVRVDSKLIHKEVVIPALTLIARQEFAAANTEFRRAHKAYRAKDFETSLTECAKAFESVLKVILNQHGITFQPTMTAQKLIELCIANKIFGDFLNQGFTGLRSMLESAIPTIRNKNSAHGAGAVPRIIPPHLATLQIHQTAVVIRFLIEASDQHIPTP